ncbi:MAG: c-type cytochrome [Acidobacteria bacterium]|nr:c-type cytochrome [Acidobacteriota bacterium]
MAIKRPDQILDHEYDGIQEMDYPIPGWFNAIFYGSIVFGIAYALFYHAWGGPNLTQEFEADRKEHLALVKRANPPRVWTPKEVADAEKSPAVLATGKSLFNSKCASCHMADGGGQVGPNLTDAFWINGDGTTPFLVKTIQEGVADKGMPAWEDKFKAEEILALAVQVRAFKGTTPANPKAPEGTPIADTP